MNLGKLILLYYYLAIQDEIIQRPEKFRMSLKYQASIFLPTCNEVKSACKNDSEQMFDFARSWLVGRCLLFQRHRPYHSFLILVCGPLQRHKYFIIFV